MVATGSSKLNPLRVQLAEQRSKLHLSTDYVHDARQELFDRFRADTVSRVTNRVTLTRRHITEGLEILDNSEAVFEFVVGLH